MKPRAPARPEGRPWAQPWTLRASAAALALLAAGCMHEAADEAPAEAAPAEAAAEAPDQLAAVAPGIPGPGTPWPRPRPGADLPPPGAAAVSGPAPSPDPGLVPHVYMSLQDEGPGRPISVVFAIDAARDGTPSDDPALRLTPENGLCNPQEMTRYDFPAAEAAAPMVGPAEQAQGLMPQDLPAYMAVAVTNALLARGLAAEPEDTRPLNICTRKLWERLVIAESPPSGQ